MSAPHVETVTERFCGHVIASTVRPASESDIENARKQHELGNCAHSVIVDTPSWLYDFRSCYICGAGLGTV